MIEADTEPKISISISLDIFISAGHDCSANYSRVETRQSASAILVRIVTRNGFCLLTKKSSEGAA